MEIIFYWRCVDNAVGRFWKLQNLNQIAEYNNRNNIVKSMHSIVGRLNQNRLPLGCTPGPSNKFLAMPKFPVLPTKNRVLQYSSVCIPPPSPSVQYSRRKHPATNPQLFIVMNWTRKRKFHHKLMSIVPIPDCICVDGPRYVMAAPAIPYHRIE